MELKYLQTLKTILESGSFMAAARQLNYTQSTVTFQMQQLEQDLAVKLFEKIGRKMVLTQAGRGLLPYIDTILQNVRQLQNYAKDKQALCGELKIAIPESLLTYRIQPVLQDFRQQAPEVRLSLQALNCYEIRDRVACGSVDLGIHYNVGGYGVALLFEKMLSFSLVLVASPDLRSYDRDFITAGQHKELCLLTSDRFSIYHKMFDSYLCNKGIVLNSTMEVGSTEAIKRSVISNVGVAFLPRFTVAEELECGDLQELKTELAGEQITAVCVYHKNKWQSPAMQLFIELAKKSFKDN